MESVINQQPAMNRVMMCPLCNKLMKMVRLKGTSRKFVCRTEKCWFVVEWA
jgi:uncharacterized protein YbaR (Trm112 family)